MKRNFALASASFAVIAACLLVLPTANAEEAAPVGREAAIEACSAINPVKPVKVVNAVDDGSGIGFSLVWLNDKDGNLWMCDADANGNVYAYTVLTGDLLEGAGPELIGLKDVALGEEEDPQAIAEQVCAAYPEGGGEVAAVVSDGLGFDPGYIVFIEDSTGGYHLCNATADAAVWAFEPVGEPIDLTGIETS
jgi:hypothetical protein